MNSRKKFLYVTPISEMAENRFKTHMNSLNTCVIDSQDSNHYYLSSISGKYHFRILKSQDAHWGILKNR